MRQVGRASQVPMTGAVRYTQRVERFPKTRAGPRERAGFIEAPLTGPPIRASRATVPSEGSVAPSDSWELKSSLNNPAARRAPINRLAV